MFDSVDTAVSSVTAAGKAAADAAAATAAAAKAAQEQSVAAASKAAELAKVAQSQAAALAAMPGGLVKDLRDGYQEALEERAKRKPSSNNLLPRTSGEPDSRAVK